MDNEKWLEGHGFKWEEIDSYMKYIVNARYVRVFKGRRVTVERIASTGRWDAWDDCDSLRPDCAAADTSAEAVRLFAVKVAERLCDEAMRLNEKAQENNDFMKEIAE